MEVDLPTKPVVLVIFWVSNADIWLNISLYYIGYPFLRRRGQRDKENQIQWNWNQSNKKLQACRLQDFGVWVMVIFVCVCNVGLIIFPCIPPHIDAYREKLYIKGYIYPIVTAGLMGIATIYYLLCFANPGDNDWSLLRLVRLKSEIRPVCTRQRHPYFGYQYRAFITDTEASKELKGKEKAATRPELMIDDLMSDPLGSPNIPRAQGPSRPLPEVPEIDSAVLIEVLDQFPYIALVFMCLIL